MSYKIILLGTHEYNWLLNPFMFLFRKYWGSGKIVYITDKVIDDIDCMQVPAYSEGVWNWHQWFSNGLVSICEYYKDELLVVFLLDHWLNRPVNLNYVNQLAEYMHQHDNIIRGNLTVGTCLDNYGKIIDTYKDLDIVSVPSHHRHCSFGGGITFCPSIFNANNLLKVLGNHWSFHDTEKLGTESMNNLKSIGTKQPILYRTHAMYHQKRNTVSLVGLNDDIKEMIPDDWTIEE